MANTSDSAARLDTSAYAARLRRWASSATSWSAAVTRRDALALAVFALAAAALMLPVAAQPRSLVLGSLGDNVQYVYMTGWVGQSLLLGLSPLTDPRLGFPDSLALAATDAPFLSMLAVAPATLALGPVFGYNLLIFLSHVLSGYFVYLWLLRLTGSRGAGIVAGLAFALAPYRLIHSAGHPQMVSTQMLPLFFWALDAALSTNRVRPRHLWALGAAIFLVGCMSQYYLVICLVTGAAYALLASLPHPLGLRDRALPLAGAVLLGALLGMLPYLMNLGGGDYEPYHIARTRIWSAAPYHFLLPSQLHPLWGALPRSLDADPRWGEKSLYLGAAAGALAACALLWRRGPYRRRGLTWLGTALVAAVLALGTDLHLGGESVRVEAPVWLPAYYLAQLPLMDIMRVWSRFGAITILFVCLLAGLGAARLIAWRGDRAAAAHAQRPRASGLRAAALPALLAALVCLDFAPASPGTSVLAPRPVDLWLAAQPGDFAVAMLPAGNDVANYRNMFGSLFHGKHVPAFNHPYHIPRAYRDYALLTRDFPNPYALWYLRQQNYRYAVLEKRFFAGEHRLPWAEIERRLAESPELRVVAEVDGFVVVDLSR
ncbi:MAG: hypothetical protein RLZZ387_1064 [Chloroflexota bacterium]